MAIKTCHDVGAELTDVRDETIGLNNILAKEGDEYVSINDWRRIGQLVVLLDALRAMCIAQLNSEYILNKYLALAKDEEEKFDCMRTHKKGTDMVIEEIKSLPKILDGAEDYRILQLQTSVKKFSRDLIKYLDDPAKEF